MRKFLTYMIPLLLACLQAKTQDPKIGRRNLHIGIVAPLYLDSVFRGENFRYENSFPRFVYPGTEFLIGAEMALDTLNLPKSTHIRAVFIDSRSVQSGLESLIADEKLNDLDMIIGSVKDDDFITLAGFAGRRNIPFISATYPNDGGIRLNPNLVILNPTLKAHCESLFAYLLQQHGNENIYLVRKTGSQEDRVESYFKKANKPDGKPLLKMQVITVDDDFDVVRARLDSNKTSIIIGGSLDEEFSETLCRELYRTRNTYKVKLMGMPNWENFNIVRNGSLKDFPVYYTSYYFNGLKDSLSLRIRNKFLEKYKAAPGDNAFKGFAAVHYFARLLALHPEDPLGYINNPMGQTISDYYLKPVFVNGKGFEFDYLENKHLYIVRALNGSVSNNR